MPILGIYMTTIIAPIGCWKMSGAKLINYMVCNCFDINFANLSLGEDVWCMQSLQLALPSRETKPKCEHLYLKANVLKSLGLSRSLMWFGGLTFFSCMIQC